MAEDVASALQGRKIFDLGVELYHGMPNHPFHALFSFQLMREHGDLIPGMVFRRRSSYSE